MSRQFTIINSGPFTSLVPTQTQSLSKSIQYTKSVTICNSQIVNEDTSKHDHCVEELKDNPSWIHEFNVTEPPRYPSFIHLFPSPVDSHSSNIPELQIPHHKSHSYGLRRREHR